jgi:hypothetical protein
MRGFAQEEASRILIPQGLLATDPGRPHQIERRLKVNLDLEITATFHGKTNENTGDFRMRPNTFPHAEVRRNVDTGYSEGINLNRRERADCRNSGSFGQHETEVIPGYEF